MKPLIFIFTILLSTALQSQVADQFFSTVGSTNYTNMGQHFAADVELCINDVTDIVSRDQAVASIRAFLQKNKPTRIKPMHGGSNAKNNSKYKLAKLETSNGTFRVFVFQGKKGKIQEVRFDKF